MIDWRALHMDTVIVKGVFQLMHNPPVSHGLPLGADLREHDPALEQCPGFHGQPVAGTIVVAVMIHEKVCMVADLDQEFAPILPAPFRRAAEGLHAGKP